MAYIAANPVDPIALAQALIRCASVTPDDGGALALLAATLSETGFACEHLVFSDDDTADVANLYARLGTTAPNFCFAGHTDVVPIGARNDWRHDPFAGNIVDGVLYGRGATDMKGAVAAFAAAVARYLGRHGPPDGSISMLITGDEEGPAINGTKKVLDWLATDGQTIDACLVGEPTNPAELGDMIKIGRRGSLTGELVVHGIQGHTAYPHLADNPVHRLIAMLDALLAEPLDDGSEHFQASSLQIASVDVGNPATNVIPATARARFNIRFNDNHDGTGLIAWLGRTLDAIGGRYELTTRITGESFICPPGRFSELVVDAVAAVTGNTPELSTTGGTSDARFIKDHCNAMAEFGLISQTMHQVDEHVEIAVVEQLTAIYLVVLERYFDVA